MTRHPSITGTNCWNRTPTLTPLGHTLHLQDPEVIWCCSLLSQLGLLHSQTLSWCPGHTRACETPPHSQRTWSSYDSFLYSLCNKLPLFSRPRALLPISPVFLSTLTWMRLLVTLSWPGYIVRKTCSLSEWNPSLYTYAQCHLVYISRIRLEERCWPPEHIKNCSYWASICCYPLKDSILLSLPQNVF